jgi:uncharacterized protein YjaZ
MISNLKIVPMYKGIKEYVEKVKTSEKTDYELLWKELVIDAFWSQWATGQFNEDRVREEMKQPITDFDFIEKTIHMLEESKVEDTVKAVYKKITELLPPQEPDRVICIQLSDNNDQATNGVVGSCVGDNILININPLIPNWDLYLPWVLAHEYHHCIWGYNYFYLKGNYRVDLLTSMLSEGQADSFGKALCPELSPSWTRAISQEDELKQWDILKEYLKEDDSMELHCRFFFGDCNTNTPPHTAYTIGFNIIQKYLEKHTSVSLLELVDKEAMDILEGSCYC